MNNTFIINDETNLTSWIALYSCQHNPPILAYFLWFFIFLFAFFNLVFGIYAIVQSLRNNDRMNYNLFIAICILFIGSGITCALTVGQSIYCSTSQTEWLLFSLMAGLMYGIGLSLVYLLYVLRLNQIFETTEYKLSKCLYELFMAGFFVQLVAPLVGLPLFSSYGDISCALNAYSLYSLTNFAFNVSLLCAFCRKIYILGQAIIENNNSNIYYNMNERNNNNNNDHDRNDLNNKLNKLLNPTIRYILCAFTAMISSNILSIYGFYRSISDSPLLWAFHLTLIVMDQTINIFCLYLQYPFGNANYEQYCACVHKWIHRIAIQAIYDSIVQTDHDISRNEDNIVVSTDIRVTSANVNNNNSDLINEFVCVPPKNNNNNVFHRINDLIILESTSTNGTSTTSTSTTMSTAVGIPALKRDITLNDNEPTP